MMTAVMDRLLTAPDASRRSPHRTASRAPRHSPGAAARSTDTARRVGTRAADPAPDVGTRATDAARGVDKRSATPARRVSTRATDTPPVADARRADTRSADARIGSVVRRIVTGVLAGAVTMLGVASIDTFGGATVPVLGSFAALPAAVGDAPEVVEVPPPPATPGTCLTWSRADAADTEVVDCAQPHLFEQAGTVLLTDQNDLPDDRGWRQLVNERCTPVVLAYLDDKFDPDGRFRVGALKPSPTKWAEGDRELRCGLQSAARSGALYATTGRVADSEQSAVREPGTCLGIDGRTIGDPVDCTAPHAVETVGVVDRTEKFPEAFPEVADQDAFLQPECSRIAAEYASGAEAISAKKLTVYWDNLTGESWTAGTRKINCNLAALLPDRSGFAPVTGSVRDEVVVVGEAPAPPAENTPPPGVPAPPNPPPAPEPVEPPAAEPPPAEPSSPIPPGPVDGQVPPVAPPDGSVLTPPDGLPLPQEGT